MKLGCFSISLAVKDIKASEQFYRKLGFEIYHGEADKGWLIMKNGETNIGLFQGMFDKNIMTFNPGWNHAGKDVDDYTDVRQIQQSLKGHGVELEVETDESASGPAHIVFTDPDGNQIMIDQHR